MTPEQLAALGDKLRTQDNLATEHPLYVVYDKERIMGIFDDVHYENKVYRRLAYVEINRFRTACLTMDAAKDYIRDNAHHLREPFVFVESLHRNPQMIAIRRHLMEQGK